MESYQTTLLQLLSKALFARNVALKQDDYLQVLKEAKNQAVTQLVYSVLDQNLLSAEEKKHWEAGAISTVINNIKIIHNHELLHHWMEDAEIPYVILKGCASAYYYPNPSYRTMGDVDFFVPDNCLEKAGKTLEKEGLVPWDQEHIAHIVYRKKGMHLEMHFNLAGTPNGEAGELVRNYTKDIFEKASVCKIGNGYVQLPSPFHHGLILLLHTSHHLTGEGIGLRHLCDWAVFENRFSDTEFCALFEVPLKQIGLWKFAQIITRTAIKYLGADEKDWAVCDDAIADALIEDIMLGGNFGKKDASRSLQTMMISNRGKDGVGKKSMTKQMVESGNGVVYHNWPSAKKNKVLLPVGWVYFGCRRVIRELTGKRNKTDVRHVIDSASYRRALYQQFCLFEREE